MSVRHCRKSGSTIDTDEITDKLFSENLEEKLSAMREYGA